MHFYPVLGCHNLIGRGSGFSAIVTCMTLTV